MAICGAIAKNDIDNFTFYTLEVTGSEATREYLSHLPSTKT
jgi:hypothetical protein